MSSTTAISPAGTPPYGQFSDFDHPASQQDAIIAVCTVFLVLTLFFVGLRLYFAARVIHIVGAEDYMCIAATILSFADMGIIIQISYMSRHIWNVPGSWLDGSYWKRRFAQNFLMTFAFFTSRLPFLLLYLRLFGSDKMTRYGVYIGGIAVSLVYLVYIPLIPIFCAPGPGRNWGSPEVFAKCTRIIPYALVYGVGNIVLDLYILLLPMPMIWRLKLPFEKKLGVSVLFTTGAFVVIASIIGIVYRIRLTFERDLTWNQGAFDAISIVEINTAIICSSMPACASFFKHLSAKSTFFASVRSCFGRAKPTKDTGGKDSKTRSKAQTWLALTTPSASRHHVSTNSWQKIGHDQFDSRTQMADPAWHDPDASPEEQLEGGESAAYPAAGGPTTAAADYDEESAAGGGAGTRMNGIMKSITVNITSQRNPLKL